MSVERGTGKPLADEEGRSSKSISDGVLSRRRGVNCSKGERRTQGNMYLFILLFPVYLIVTLTRSECVSAAGLRFGFFWSLQNGCVYLFPESVTLNTCVSEMRLIKFDEEKMP